MSLGDVGRRSAILNLLHGCEVRAAIEMNALADVTDDVPLKMTLARHAAEDARHAYELLRRIATLGLPWFRVPRELDRLDAVVSRCRARDVREISAERSLVSDATVMEVLAAIVVAKGAFVRTMREGRDSFADDAETDRVLDHVLEEESAQVASLTRALERFERRFSRRAVQATHDRLESVLWESAEAYRHALARWMARDTVRC